MSEQIQRKGVIPFARFMEIALYAPAKGYYERADRPIGRSGDFYTNVSVGSLFGQLLAFQLSIWLAKDLGRREQGRPGHPGFQILEAGAHDGRLSADILNWIRRCRPEIFSRLEYWILEPSSRRRQAQHHTLHELARQVQWFESWEQISGICGIIFSNELLDAFPVHRLGWDAREKNWFEWGVTLKNGRFDWTRMPVTEDCQLSAVLIPRAGAPSGTTPGSDRAALFRISEWLPLLPDGYILDICPAAVDWWRHAASKLQQGKLLTIDYGLTAEQFLAPERLRGTARAYRHHHVNHDLLSHPGEQDLTAHVNFTALQIAGEQAGLHTEGLIPQERFFTRIAEPTWKPASNFGEWTPARVRQFHTLTHPEFLGRSFQVLIQSRVG